MSAREAPRLTFEEIEQFAKILKQLINETPLKWWIVAAGVGGVAETLYILWRALRYAFRIYH